MWSISCHHLQSSNHWAVFWDMPDFIEDLSRDSPKLLSLSVTFDASINPSTWWKMQVDVSDFERHVDLSAYPHHVWLVTTIWTYVWRKWCGGRGYARSKDRQSNPPIWYLSKTLNEAQETYTTIEKELLAVVCLRLKSLRLILLALKLGTLWSFCDQISYGKERC